MMTIRVFEPQLSSPVIKEILRYAGVRGDGEEIRGEILSLLPNLDKCFLPKACYAELEVSVSSQGVVLGGVLVKSQSLARLLFGAKRAVIFAATAGLMLDREIARLGAVSPAKQLLADAYGTERVEAICDALCIELERQYEGSKITKRFSAGYGDVPLELQKDIFALLDCPRKIGLTLNESLLMSPSKSVTAIVGIIDN